MKHPTPALKEHHGREYIVACIGAVAEYLSVKYEVSSLAWLAALLFFLAIMEYTRRWFSGRQWRYASWVALSIVIATGTYFITREKGRAEDSKIEQTEKPKSEERPTATVPNISASPNNPESKPSSQAHPTPRVDWHDKQNWRSFLRTGMTRAEVRRLFGDPEKMAVISKDEFWNYGEGELYFSEGRLYSWTEP